MAEDRVIRVGMVGANPAYGWGSGVHRRVVERLPGFVLKGVCTTREDSARAASEAFRAPLWFTDGRALAGHADIDLVAICVKAPHHYDVARAALDAGKHVYCEWPLTTTLEQSEELAALAEARGVKAMIGLHLRGSAAMRQAAQMIVDGYVGDVHNVSLNARMFGPVMRAMAMRAGGTTLLSIYGGHLLDALDHYFGGIVDIAMRGAIHLPPVDETGAPVSRDAFDHLKFHGILVDGALFNVDLAGVSLTDMGCTWRIDGHEGSLVLTTRDPGLPAVESLVLHGARRGAQMAPIPIEPSFDCSVIPASPDRYEAYPNSFASREALAAIGTLYAELGDAIRRGGPVEPDFRHAVKVQRLLANAESAAIVSPYRHIAGAMP
ncbi:putative dehydrogenase [Sphingobium sp. OAS761]|uniref:Gfo/Idh/MocA family protein n=1 Tax=Sphingobium sp. OAS761 TaxID=2817901 RepID=UPI0020A195FC|nr:Gfo/Idh/MocA family oxidoreductase [Sphingobium sp. OAS761]MCP1470422.1 putative dehydrogenase [Sphingobium sp. OAS761]